MPGPRGATHGAAATLTRPPRLVAADRARRLLPELRAALRGSARLAARALGVPMALLSIVGADRVYAIDAYGLPPSRWDSGDVPVGYALCGDVVRLRAAVVLADIRTDSVCRQRAVVRDTGIRAYLGVPLAGPDGELVGALGVADLAPRQWTPEQVAVLEDTARLISAGITAPAASSGASAGPGPVERRRTEELRLELARTKDEFIALAGHSLRTPLTTIVSLTELLLSAGDELADERVELLTRVKANADTLRGIVEDVLVLAGLESGHINLSRGPLDLARLVADAVAAVLPGAAADVVVETHLPDELPVTGDYTRLRQAVDNLLSNAVKYSPDGGTVRVGLVEDGGWAELTVTDEGLGVPEAERDRLFNRFFRGATAHERGIPGTGLGLPLTRLIAELHGGTISLTDRSVAAEAAGRSAEAAGPSSGPPAAPSGGNPGTTFTLRLPVTRDAA